MKSQTFWVIKPRRVVIFDFSKDTTVSAFRFKYSISTNCLTLIEYQTLKTQAIQSLRPTNNHPIFDTVQSFRKVEISRLRAVTLRYEQNFHTVYRVYRNRVDTSIPCTYSPSASKAKQSQIMQYKANHSSV